MPGIISRILDSLSEETRQNATLIAKQANYSQAQVLALMVACTIMRAEAVTRSGNRSESYGVPSSDKPMSIKSKSGKGLYEGRIPSDPRFNRIVDGYPIPYDEGDLKKNSLRYKVPASRHIKLVLLKIKNGDINVVSFDPTTGEMILEDGPNLPERLDGKPVYRFMLGKPGKAPKTTADPNGIVEALGDIKELGDRFPDTLKQYLLDNPAKTNRLYNMQEKFDRNEKAWQNAHDIGWPRIKNFNDIASKDRIPKITKDDKIIAPVKCDCDPTAYSFNLPEHYTQALFMMDGKLYAKKFAEAIIHQDVSLIKLKSQQEIFKAMPEDLKDRYNDAVHTSTDESVPNKILKEIADFITEQNKSIMYERAKELINEHLTQPPFNIPPNDEELMTAINTAMIADTGIISPASLVFTAIANDAQRLQVENADNFLQHGADMNNPANEPVYGKDTPNCVICPSDNGQPTALFTQNNEELIAHIVNRNAERKADGKPPLKTYLHTGQVRNTTLYDELMIDNESFQNLHLETRLSYIKREAERRASFENNVPQWPERPVPITQRRQPLDKTQTIPSLNPALLKAMTERRANLTNIAQNGTNEALELLKARFQSIHTPRSLTSNSGSSSRRSSLDSIAEEPADKLDHNIALPQHSIQELEHEESDTERNEEDTVYSSPRSTDDVSIKSDHSPRKPTRATPVLKSYAATAPTNPKTAEQTKFNDPQQKGLKEGTPKRPKSKS